MRFRRRTYRAAIRKKIDELQNERAKNLRDWEEFGNTPRQSDEYRKILRTLELICLRGRAEGYRWLI